MNRRHRQKLDTLIALTVRSGIELEIGNSISRSEWWQKVLQAYVLRVKQASSNVIFSNSIISELMSFAELCLEAPPVNAVKLIAHR